MPGIVPDVKGVHSGVPISYLWLMLQMVYIVTQRLNNDPGWIDGPWWL